MLTYNRILPATQINYFWGFVWLVWGIEPRTLYIHARQVYLYHQDNLTPDPGRGVTFYHGSLTHTKSISDVFPIVFFQLELVRSHHSVCSIAEKKSPT